MSDHDGINGFVHVPDRVTGTVLSATPFRCLTSVFGVNLETGRPQTIEAR